MILKTSGSLFENKYIIEDGKNSFAELSGGGLFNLKNLFDLKKTFTIEWIFYVKETSDKYLIKRSLSAIYPFFPFYEIYHNDTLIANFKPNIAGKGLVKFKNGTEYSISERKFSRDEFYFFKDNNWYVKFQDIYDFNNIASIEQNTKFEKEEETQILVGLGSCLTIITGNIAPFSMLFLRRFGINPY